MQKGSITCYSVLAIVGMTALAAVGDNGLRARHVCVKRHLADPRGDFGPGSFVWFPEGMTMYHGATEDSDCLMLFITNKPFNIRYTFEDEPSGSEAERLGREKACLCSMASVT